jgi:hypothetical protein
MKKTLWFVLAGLVLANSYLHAAAEDHPPPYVGSSEFEQVKSLAGTWRGTHQMAGEEVTEAVAEYSVTSNGSVVVEKLFPKTPHEMVSAYYDKNGKLSMTHYCSLGNRPEMSLASSSPNEIKLDFSGPSEINTAMDAHMHSLALVFEGDKIIQTWGYYKDGVDAGKTTITLSRAS